MPLAHPVLVGQPLKLEPAPREPADLGVNHDLVGKGNRDPPFDEAERCTRSQVEVPEPILAPPRARALPANTRTVEPGNPGKEHSRRERRRAPRPDPPEPASLP